MILAEAFDIASDGVLGHGAGLFEGVAFGDEAGEGGTSDRESAFVGGLEQDGVVVFHLAYILSPCS